MFIGHGDKGFVEIYTLVLMSLCLALSMHLFQEVILHRKVVNDFVKSIQEDYLLEGVLMEAKDYREKIESINPSVKITSIFHPEYKYYYENDRIYVLQGVSNLLTATYIIYNGEVVITGVKSQSNQIYVRE